MSLLSTQQAQDDDATENETAEAFKYYAIHHDCLPVLLSLLA